MTTKLTLTAAVTAIAGASLVVAVGWSFLRVPTHESLVDYAPNQPTVRRVPSMTRPADRMSLPWSPTATQAETGHKLAGVSTSSDNYGHSKPSRVSAALPWGNATKIERHASGITPIVHTTVQLPDTSVTQVAIELKFSPAVTAWLGMWEQKLRANDQTASNDVRRFEQLLASDAMTVEQLLSLMRVTQALEDHPQNRHADPYPPVTGAIASQAVHIGTEQARGDPRYRYLLMVQIAPLIERLWTGSPERDVGAVECFYTVLAEDKAPGTPDWIRGHLGRAEALAVQSRFGEAFDTLERFEKTAPSLSFALRCKLSFDRGQFLFSMRRFREAMPFLKLCVESSDFEERETARRLLLWALASTGDIRQTGVQLQEYCRARNVTAFELDTLRASLRTELIRAKQESSAAW